MLDIFINAKEMLFRINLSCSWCHLFLGRSSILVLHENPIESMEVNSRVCEIRWTETNWFIFAKWITVGSFLCVCYLLFPPHTHVHVHTSAHFIGGSDLIIFTSVFYLRKWCYIERLFYLYWRLHSVISERQEFILSKAIN